MTLRQFVCGTLKRPPHGATARVAAALGVPHSTATRLIYGVTLPDDDLARRIQDLIHARIDLRARNSGRKLGSKNK